MNADLLPLALAAALYPVLLAAVVVMLRAPRPTTILIGYLVGGMLLSVGLGLVIVFALGSSGLDTGSHHQVSPSVDLVVGCLLLLVVLIVTRRDRRRGRPRPRPTTKDGGSWTRRHLAGASARTAVLVGMALSLPSLYYLTALKDIAGGNDEVAVQVALIVGFNVVAFVLIEVPLVAFVLAPERTRAQVDRTNEWIARNTRQIGLGAALVLGVYLVVRGAAGLLT